MHPTCFTAFTSELVKLSEFLDTPYGKIHNDDHHYAAGHLSWGTPDDPHKTRDHLIRTISKAPKPVFKPGFFGGGKKYHQSEVESWKRTRKAKYLKNLASDFAANGEAGVF